LAGRIAARLNDLSFPAFWGFGYPAAMTFRQLLRLAFWCAAVFAFVMAVLPHPPVVPGDPSDKVQHMIAFAVLTVLGSAAYPGLRPVMLALCLCVFGAVIEVVQLIPALGRDSDVRDWIADTLAVVVMLVVVQLWLRLRPRSSDS